MKPYQRLIWKASGGREIPTDELGNEHLINILNGIESQHLTYPGDAMFNELRLECLSRGLKWRSYGPLMEGDLDGRVYFLKHKPQPQPQPKPLTLGDLLVGDRFRFADWRGEWGVMVKVTTGLRANAGFPPKDWVIKLSSHSVRQFLQECEVTRA
jgi:hypothetical protein